MLRMMLSAVVALGFSTPVLANPDHSEICVETSRIVHIAVAQRAGGMKPDSIKRGMTEGRYKVSEQFLPTVGPVVDWVFTIESGEVSAPDAAKTIAGRYRNGCMSFKP